MKSITEGTSSPVGVTRGEFMRGALACGATAACGTATFADTRDEAVSRDDFQREIDDVTQKAWRNHMAKADIQADKLAAIRARLPALGRFEDAFDKVVAEVKSTEVADKPAVWYVYNMGFIVKTRQTLFSIDLCHRRAEALAPLLDFALITHNHCDHFTERFYAAMDGDQRKTVVSNFKDNYGAHFAKRHPGGYTRAAKTFNFGDVTVRTAYTDHNSYLVDYTTTYEITAGDFTIFHSGDCSNAAKLKPQCPNPDLWMLHPFCGMDAVAGAEAVKPKLAVVVHLNELGHPKGGSRWTWAKGARAKEKLEAAGFKAVVPLWGDRIS